MSAWLILHDWIGEKKEKKRHGADKAENKPWKTENIPKEHFDLYLGNMQMKGHYYSANVHMLNVDQQKVKALREDSQNVCKEKKEIQKRSQVYFNQVPQIINYI